MQRITLSIDDDLARALDSHMKKHRYTSRSEALRDILREVQARERLEGKQSAKDEGRFCVATLAYVYNHHTRDLGRRRSDLYFLPAGFARRLPGCLGRNPRAPARLSLSPLQFRGNHAAARRASAPAEGARRIGLTFVIPGLAKREPGISRFRGWSFGPSRNDILSCSSRRRYI